MAAFVNLLLGLFAQGQEELKMLKAVWTSWFKGGQPQGDLEL